MSHLRLLGLARYGTAQVAAATVAAAWMLLVIVVVYLGLLARIAYRMLTQGAPFSLPLWPLVTGLVGLLAVALVLAPASAVADWIFRRKAVGLSRSKLVLSLGLALLATGLASWGAMLRWDLPMLPFLGVVAALMAPGFAIHWIFLHVLDGTLAFAGETVATTLEILGWRSQ